MKHLITFIILLVVIGIGIVAFVNQEEVVCPKTFIIHTQDLGCPAFPGFIIHSDGRCEFDPYYQKQL